MFSGATISKAAFSGAVALWLALVLSAAHALAASTCELWEDPQGIPHARAATLAEGYACLGYLHGRDRGWQMDFLRRTAQGRRAEVLGKDAIRSDFIMRVLGLPAKAAQLVGGMSAEDRGRLEAYARGVNRGLEVALRRGVYEFRELGYEPERWRPEDSVSVLLLQAFDQTRKTFQVRLDEQSRREHHGDALSRLFAPEGLPWDSTILKKGEYEISEAWHQEGARPEGARREAAPGTLKEAYAALLDTEFPVGQGSNNWVVAPRLSKTGKAWLANDPHLALKHPPFWYWAHVEAGELDAIGATLPGLPIIASGANRHLSWGLTNSYLDVSELSSVPVKELEASGASDERPVIWVKLWKFRWPFFFKSFQRTRQGWPVVPLPAPEGKAYVLKWSGFDLGSEDISSMTAIMTASSAREMDQRLAKVGVPSWNFVFADTSGNIGYRAVGRIPRRLASDPEAGFGPRESSVAEVDRGKLAFEETLSSSEMPNLMNPARGWVSTANNRQWPLDGRFEIGHAHSLPFRAFRIEELLQAKRRHDLESMRGIQCDVQAVDARFFVPELLRYVDGTGAEARLLKGWDFQARLDCQACALYRAWMEELLAAFKADETALYRILRADRDDRDGTENGAAGSTVGAKVREALASARRRFPGGGSPGAGSSGGGSPDRGSPGGSVAAGRGSPGGSAPAGRGSPADEAGAWGALHQNFFPHLSQDARFDRGVEGLPTPGDEHSVNPGTARWDAKQGIFQQTYGASQRLIVEMSSPPAVFSIVPGSNVDTEKRELRDPASPWKRWASCELDRREFPLQPERWQALRASGDPRYQQVELGRQ